MVTAVNIGSGIVIKLYTHSAVEYLPYDPESRRVAGLVAKYITNSNRDLNVEHIGSTAVLGCWGKGIIDLLVGYAPGELSSAQRTLERLGFQHRTAPEPFPESRPMPVGSVEHMGRIYRLHAHVVLRGASEAQELLRFRDLLQQNFELRRAYEAEKRAILARGISAGAEYSRAKGQFIRWALGIVEL